MKRKILIAAALAIAGAGCATASSTPELSAKAAERLAAYKQTGEKKSCLSLTQIRSIDALDDSHLLVTTVNGDHYLNAVSGRCSSASRAGYYIQYTVSGNQLCRNEIIRVIDNSSDFVAGSCGLGDFERLEDAPADES